MGGLVAFAFATGVSCFERWVQEGGVKKAVPRSRERGHACASNKHGRQSESRP